MSSLLNFFENNWYWIVGAVVLMIIVLLIMLVVLDKKDIRLQDAIEEKRVQKEAEKNVAKAEAIENTTVADETVETVEEKPGAKEAPAKKSAK